jgi:hypothetical protein
MIVVTLLTTVVVVVSLRLLVARMLFMIGRTSAVTVKVRVVMHSISTTTCTTTRTTLNINVSLLTIVFLTPLPYTNLVFKSLALYILIMFALFKTSVAAATLARTV